MSIPLDTESLPLEPEPQSVKAARSWVGDMMDKLGREDLADAAELGVSELVTNAILHAASPITVRVRGTKAHPRVEVHDHSRNPPEVNVEMTDDDQLLSTVGRGLGIVALYSTAWGSEVSTDGKTVWFEPTNQERLGGDLSGDVFDFSDVVDKRLAEASEPEGLIRIRLLGMPVQVFAHYRSRYVELRRELRLLSLDHSGDYPVAQELSELTVQIEQERRQAVGVSVLDQAIADGLEWVDLEYLVPPSAPASMARMLAALEKADEFCRAQRLLALSASPQQLALQRWYLGEFTRQAAGKEPTAWPGSYIPDSTQ